MNHPFVATRSVASTPPRGAHPEEAAPSARTEWLLLTTISLVAVSFRLHGLATLPWDEREAAALVTGIPLAQRLLPATLGAATPALLYTALRKGAGAWTALAAAWLVAASPWHLHLSQLGGPGASVFALAAVGAALAVAAQGLWRRSAGLASIAGLAALAALIVASLGLPSRNAAPDRNAFLEWLAADVGLAVPLLALAGLTSRVTRGGCALALLVMALLLMGGARPSGDDVRVAALLGPCFVAAAVTLGAWCDAAGGSGPSGTRRLALLVLAVVPALPSLASELKDGGRFDLAPLAREFAARRHAGEPVLASARILVAREFDVECRDLPPNVAELAAALPNDRDCWIVLLYDRGRPLADNDVTQAVISSCQLIARTGRKRLDLHRYEAFLYKFPRKATR